MARRAVALRNLILTVAASGAISAAQAAPIESSGEYNGLTWQATSTIVGVTSTGTVAAGGDPRYFAPMPQYSGVVSLIMNYQNGAFICSGTLLPDRRSILTAAHCVTPDATTGALLSTSAFFYGGSDPDTVVPFNAASTQVGISEYFVHSDYTGQVIDENDIAVLRLVSEAPDFASSYGLYLPGDNDLTGEGFNVAGYGGRSTIGGNLGVNAGTGRLRQGDNRFDFRLGDPDFGGFWDGFFGTADVDNSYLSDFDNGLAANDTACRIAAALGLSGAKYCNVGVGADEVSTAGGDSGGPQFINGMISSVTSYGLSFGPNFGDINPGLNSSFGEFNGFVPVFIHADFILASMVPEPGSLVLVSLALLALGAGRRRQRR